METKHFENPASFLVKTLAQKKKGGEGGNNTLRTPHTLK